MDGPAERSPEAAAALALFGDDMRALCKTVKNGDWLGLLWQLVHGERTSLSCPPPGGKGMLLFGRATSGCVGLVWDRAAIELDGGDTKELEATPAERFVYSDSGYESGRSGMRRRTDGDEKKYLAQA